VLIQSTDEVQDLKILNFFTPVPIHFQLDLNTNTERVNSLSVDEGEMFNGKHSCDIDE